jgi:hypothetical protein
VSGASTCVIRRHIYAPSLESVPQFVNDRRGNGLTEARSGPIVARDRARGFEERRPFGSVRVAHNCRSDDVRKGGRGVDLVSHGRIVRS